MTVTAAWYNEPDPFKAAVIREAIKAGAIADGVVDERSIKDVRASDLVEYTQCHFFAGGGFWSLALRRAGWPDDRHVWTGSCPCPSFSAAGKGGGFDDPRHLWPDWEKLIRECRPATIFGEQADDSIGYGWLDLVQTDLEASDYATAAVDLCAAGIGAPHIRQRLFWCADALQSGRAKGWARAGNGSPTEGGGTGGRSDSNGRNPGAEWEQRSGKQRLFTENCGLSIDSNPIRQRLQEQLLNGRISIETMEPSEGEAFIRAGYTRGFWRGCDWWYGRDEKFRPIEPKLFPLATGVSKRMGKLRGYGNSIVPEITEEFIRAYLGSCSEN
jgi:DNA (cytosine-5)-methyltransferase 1